MFPDKSDAILKNTPYKPKIDSIGSLGLFLGDSKCHQTFPNQTLIGEKKFDWCSVIPKDPQTKPWISYSYNNKAMKIHGFSVRNGCCFYYCCCEYESGQVYDYDCCCRLYSFSLQGSNDNITWKTIHSVEKENTFYRCEYKTYEFPTTQPFSILRLVLDEPRPGYQNCMQINQIEFYGELVDSFSSFSSFEDDNEESVSIIGKIKKE